MASMGELSVNINLDVSKETVVACEKLLCLSLEEPDIVHVVSKDDSITGQFQIVERSLKGLVLRKVGDQHE